MRDESASAFASAAPGALHVSSATYASIDDCKFLSNSAISSSGAVYIMEYSRPAKHAAIRRSRFVANGTPDWGGALMVCWAVHRPGGTCKWTLGLSPGLVIVWEQRWQHSDLWPP